MDVPGILDSIAADAARGEIVFPTHAEMALRVRRAVDDPDCSLDHLARLIQAEPLLAARVVGIANSVTYNRSGKAIADVRNAVARIGFKTIRALATAVVVRQMEDMPKAPAHRQLAIRLWEHTAQVASLAYVIAKRVTHQDPDTAFFAGIVHEVGAFYLISRAGDFPGLLDQQIPDWDGEREARIGRAVLTVLGVPEAVVAAIEALWEGYLAMPPETLGDTLLLADQLATVESPLSQLAGLGRQGTAVDIDVALDDDTLSGILRESAEELESLTGALRS
jgi:HD-like signal output (HDOD) protein